MCVSGDGAWRCGQWGPSGAVPDACGGRGDGSGVSMGISGGSRGNGDYVYVEE